MRFCLPADLLSCPSPFILQTVDCRTLAILVPLLLRGLTDRTTPIRRKACVISESCCNVVCCAASNSTRCRQPSSASCTFQPQCSSLRFDLTLSLFLAAVDNMAKLVDDPKDASEFVACLLPHVQARGTAVGLQGLAASPQLVHPSLRPTLRNALLGFSSSRQRFQHHVLTTCYLPPCVARRSAWTR